MTGAPAPQVSGYVENGPAAIYYDIRGNGPPLVLLHGGMATLGLFDTLRGSLDGNWTTVGIEQQGHGHTADIDRPLRFATMVEDTAAVIRRLGLERPHVFGYSDGGNVALGLAIHHPDLVGRVAICGTNSDNGGLEPETRKMLLEGADEDPEALAAKMPPVLRDAYRSVAPKPVNWPTLVHKVFELAATFEGWSEAELRALEAPLLVIAGDHDVVTVDHQAWLSRTCPHGQLCILPRTDHLAPVSRAGWIAHILNDFLREDLDQPMPMQAAR